MTPWHRELPLYTLWREAQPAYMAYAVAHCTVGDLRARGRARGLVAVSAALLAIGYTVFSEWMNIAVLRSWAYSELMPTVDVGQLELALYLSRPGH